MGRKRSDDEVSESRNETVPATGGRYAYDGLERVIHEKARLGIMASLVAHPGGVLFGDLKDYCSLTDGNLNRHLKVLQAAGLVEIWKGSRANRPQTLCRVTADGKVKFMEYVTELERVVADAAKLLGHESTVTPAAHIGWTTG